ncbi:MAG: 4Fe-4S binding protein [Tepidisphaeraceae bacterium]
MADDPQLGRRQFFRRGLSELLKPLAKALEPVERTLDEFDKLSKPKPTPTRTPLDQQGRNELCLRPPGALPEKQFLDTCSRCGECVKVCPAEAIRLEEKSGGGARSSTPTAAPVSRVTACIA